MKRALSPRKLLPYALAILVASIVLILLVLTMSKPAINHQAETVSIKTISSQIQADGSIVAQDQATLHFQTGGKLIYLPVKQGDSVTQGQTIASLDTTTLQKQLTQALNTYRSTRDSFDQTTQNQSNNVIQHQQSATTGQSDTSYLNDVAKRIVDQNQANLDNSVLNVEIAQQALQLATLTAPINGVVTNMDVTTAGVNVTPTTSFTVADPSTLVFRVGVSESNIDYIGEGNAVTIKLSGGAKTTLTGSVDKIYPDKVTLPNGEKEYQVDIAVTNLPSTIKMGQTGTALIQSVLTDTARLVPTWTILNHDSVWVVSDGTTQLKKVTIGKTHGDMTEVLEGLNDGDQVVTNPESIAAQKYQLL
jgi:RND family efflux transporter MFP subunit